MTRILNVLCRLITVFVGVALAVMTVIMISLVVTRYFFSFSAPWSEEVTRYLMVWLVMLGGAMLVLFEDHITLHLFSNAQNSFVHRVRVLVIRLIVLGVGLITAWTGYKFAFSMMGIYASGSGLSMALPIFSIPISMTLITIFMAILILRDFTPEKALSDLPQQSEFMDGSFRPADGEE